MAKQRPKFFDQCTVIRRKFVKSYVGFEAAKADRPSSEKWVTEPCGTPLFGDEATSTGVCRSCKTFWTHEHNRLATDEERAEYEASIEAR